MKKRIAILGSTGSIGTQTLEVVQSYPEAFEVEVLTANENYQLLISQAQTFVPNTVVIGNPHHYNLVNEALFPLGIKVFAGPQAIEQVVEMESVDMVVIALVGFSGLLPTLKAIEAGKLIATANKETFVVAGELVTQKARQKSVNLYPIDSEHSAIFQCLVGEFHNPVEKIFLTASGGPFRGKNSEQLEHVTIEQALNHPNWNMGSKVTIDSASLMNKGLEVIEAHWLFGLQAEQIEVIIHPQSIIHSIVQFSDGSMKAQMGLPDMKLPILYALSYPNRLKTLFPRFDFMQYPQLTFQKPDTLTFRNLTLAYHALKKGGNMPCILNAANEVAVNAFLKKQLGFLQMSEIIEKCLNNITFVAHPDLDTLLKTDSETRIKATELLTI